MPGTETANSQQVPEPSKHQQLLWGLQCSLILLTIWLSLNGTSAFTLGLLTSLAGGALGARYVPGHPYPWRPLRLLAFFGYFFCTSLAGAWDIARRALLPRPLPESSWLRYRMQLPAGQPRTLLVSVVSLIPGTLSADLEADNMLLVHALGGSAEEAARAVASLEARIAHLFSLPLEPNP